MHVKQISKWNLFLALSNVTISRFLKLIQVDVFFLPCNITNSSENFMNISLWKNFLDSLVFTYLLLKKTFDAFKTFTKWVPSEIVYIISNIDNDHRWEFEMLLF